jgi:sulfate adenylyltransferase subunit 2
MKRKISETEFMLREVKRRFKNPCQLWSAGKDSTVLLHITKELFREIPWNIVFIETTFHSPTLIKFRDELVREWDIPLIIAKRKSEQEFNNRERCCYERKTLALRECIEENQFDAGLVAIRWDEHGIRGKERFFSPRNQEFRWLYNKQDLELASVYITEFSDAHHIRVHPLLHWSLDDIWGYILEKKLTNQSIIL